MIYSTIKILGKILLLSLYCIVFAGCGKKKDDLTDKPENAILCVKNSDSLESVERCYTNDTIKLSKNLISKKLITEEQIFSILKFTDKGDAWINVEENINNNKALISIQFTKHSRENMKALQLNLKAENVNGLWKLDMSDSLQVYNNENKSINKYLIDKFKGY